MVTRQNVYELGNDWAAPTLWYARGVKAMKARKLADPNGWQFWAAIHGIDRARWSDYHYLKPGDKDPDASLVKKYWNECQHGSWFFLPWHRGYLLAFEANIRDEVVRLKGPTDWALPYWNYFKPDQSDLPPAFASRAWPDGEDDNPLFVKERWGPSDDGRVYVPVQAINLDAMSEPDFTGGAHGGSPGFGGIDTGFKHGGQTHGALELQPHDNVHGFVGGTNPAAPHGPGLMAHPDTAGLDPIFWLHHANIDRLWEVWRRTAASHIDPIEPRWIDGPASIGQRVFSLPMPSATNWDYTPGRMTTLLDLGYDYDDLAPLSEVVTPHKRLINLVGARAAELDLGGVVGMDKPKNVELVGASAGSVPIRGDLVKASVQLDPTARKMVVASLRAAFETAAPDRVFLNLENVRGNADATTFSVYIDVPKSDKPTDHPERLAGSVALFGVSKASKPNDEQAGQGLNYVLEISRIVDALHLQDKLDANQLQVSIVPFRPVPDEAEVTIGRISVYRQGR